MRNLKTFEEYKHIKLRKYVDNPIWDEREGRYGQIPNEKDPNEPFFNKNKRKYREETMKKKFPHGFYKDKDGNPIDEPTKNDWGSRQKQEWDDMETDMENSMRDLEKDEPEEQQKASRTRRENNRRQTLGKSYFNDIEDGVIV